MQNFELHFICQERGLHNFRIGTHHGLRYYILLSISHLHYLYTCATSVAITDIGCRAAKFWRFFIKFKLDRRAIFTDESLRRNTFIVPVEHLSEIHSKHVFLGSQHRRCYCCSWTTHNVTGLVEGAAQVGRDGFRHI